MRMSVVPAGRRETSLPQAGTGTRRQTVVSSRPHARPIVNLAEPFADYHAEPRRKRRRGQRITADRSRRRQSLLTEGGVDMK